MAYKTLSVRLLDFNRLAADVTAAIADGWQPLGAPVVVDDLLVQAMICGGIASDNSDYTLPAASADAIGGVKLADAVADSVVADAADIGDLVTSFNALLASLRASGALDA
jgi:hypothetical protein